MDPQLLYKVRAGLGFGFVRETHYCPGLYRFAVEDITGVRRLMAIFNGNLILPKVRHRYENWVKGLLKSKILNDFKLSNRAVLPSLETAWIGGFSEAEGCFYAGLTTPSQRSVQQFRLTQKFSITQKNVLGEKEILEQINDLFENKARLTKPKNSENCFRIEINAIKCQQILVNYFQKFSLKGKKKITAFRWWRILLLRSKDEHYQAPNKRKLERLVHSLNESTKKQVATRKKIKEMDEEQNKLEGLKI